MPWSCIVIYTCRYTETGSWQREQRFGGSHVGQSTELDPELLSTKTRIKKTKHHQKQNNTQQNTPINKNITKMPMRTGKLKGIYSHWSLHCFILESIGVSIVTMGKQFCSGQEWFLLLSYPTFYSKKRKLIALLHKLQCYIHPEKNRIKTCLADDRGGSLNRFT